MATDKQTKPIRLDYVGGVALPSDQCNVRDCRTAKAFELVVETSETHSIRLGFCAYHTGSLTATLEMGIMAAKEEPLDR